MAVVVVNQVLPELFGGRERCVVRVAAHTGIHQQVGGRSGPGYLVGVRRRCVGGGSPSIERRHSRAPLFVLPSSVSLVFCRTCSRDATECAPPSVWPKRSRQKSGWTDEPRRACNAARNAVVQQRDRAHLWGRWGGEDHDGRVGRRHGRRASWGPRCWRSPLTRRGAWLPRSASNRSATWRRVLIHKRSSTRACTVR